MRFFVIAKIDKCFLIVFKDVATGYMATIGYWLRFQGNLQCLIQVHRVKKKLKTHKVN